MPTSFKSIKIKPLNKQLKRVTIAFFALVMIYAGLRIYLNYILKRVVIEQVEQFANKNFKLEDILVNNVSESLKEFNDALQRHSIVLLDNYGHPIVDHDLYNTDGLTEDGIAEAFIEFGKKESLSFF